MVKGSWGPSSHRSFTNSSLSKSRGGEYLRGHPDDYVNAGKIIRSQIKHLAVELATNFRVINRLYNKISNGFSKNREDDLFRIERLQERVDLIKEELEHDRGILREVNEAKEGPQTAEQAGYEG